MSDSRTQEMTSTDMRGARGIFPCVSAARGRAIGRLRTEPFDLLVIGGGITGAGIALDAVLRGMRVALVDKGDFASGTSSASSKLIHGGLRYLEHGEFSLVREALRERHILLKIAPHLVRPLRIVVPHYTGARRPRWMVKLGLTLYDWLAGRQRIGRHRKLTTRELTAEICNLRSDGLIGGFQFYDAQMDDARLCLEVILSASQRGAASANYVELVTLSSESSHVRRCEVIDRLTGDRFHISTRSVVNAAGPWVDHICRIENQAAPARLATSKGVHIVLPGVGLAAGVLVTHPADGRVMFILPWMGRTLVGTTDTFSSVTPDDVAAEPEDSNYLLDAANYYLSNSFNRSDIISTLAGLRPLLSQDKKHASAVSREFSIMRSESGLWSIAGGKYTTYRSMAERMVDEVVAELGGEFSTIPSSTATHRLIGTPDQDWMQFVARTRQQIVQQVPGASTELAEHLIGRYGARALDLAAEFGDRALWQSVVPGEPDVRAEFEYQAKYEMAVKPSDHLLRRTRLGLFRPDAFPGLLD